MLGQAISQGLEALAIGIVGASILALIGTAIVVICRAVIRRWDRRVEAARIHTRRAEPVDFGAEIRAFKTARDVEQARDEFGRVA